MKTIKQFRDTRFGRKPRNAVAALKQARAFLQDEGKRWIKGAEFAGRSSAYGNLPKNFDPNNPLCGSWGVCAIGSVALVTGDLAVMCDDTWPNEAGVGIRYGGVSQVYSDAVNLLDEVARADGTFKRINGYAADSIVELNDNHNTKRKDVIRQFDRAIALAEQEANAERGRKAAQAKRRARKAVYA